VETAAGQLQKALVRIFDKEFVFPGRAVFAAAEGCDKHVDTCPHLNLVTRIERAPRTNNPMTEVQLIVKKTGKKGAVEASYGGTTQLRHFF
jgi:hypothetical protein